MINLVDICDNCDFLGDNCNNGGDIFKDDDCDEISQIWKLHLRNVVEADRGCYMCQVTIWIIIHIICSILWWYNGMLHGSCHSLNKYSRREHNIIHIICSILWMLHLSRHSLNKYSKKTWFTSYDGIMECYMCQVTHFL